MTVQVGDPCNACCTSPCDFGVGCSQVGVTLLHATLTALSANCDCLSGLIIPLIFDAVSNSFIGQASLPSPPGASCNNDNGCTVRISLDCFGAGLEADCLGCNNNPGLLCASQTAQVDVASATCSPLYLRYTLVWTNHVPNLCGDTTPAQAHFCCSKVPGQITDTGTFRVEVTT